MLTKSTTNTVRSAREYLTPSQRKYALWTSICVFLVVSYLPVFTFYAKQHWSVSNLQGAYSHAPLAVVLIAFLIWRQREKLSIPEWVSPQPGSLAWLTLGVVLKVYGDVQGFVVLQGMSLIPVMLGLARLYGDAPTARALRFPILFLFFIIPLPGAAIDALTLPLVQIATDSVAAALPAFNIDVVKTGHVLTVNAHGLEEFHEIIMAPECSGIRSFVSLLALSCLFTHLQGQSLGHSTVLMLATIPLVILGNFIRVTLTVLMIVNVSPETAENFFHWSSGLLVFIITMLGLLLVNAFLKAIAVRRVQANA